MFGLANAALFEEFKTVIMGPATGAPTVERNVAVSEIDFSACEPCTPSYRPLPDYYMRHACSERTEVEKQVRFGLYFFVVLSGLSFHVGGTQR